MALTMVHLLVAERWAQKHPEFHDCPEFYLGAISPDAIHIRDKDDKSRKNEFHLNNWISPHPEDVIAYWKDNRNPFDVGFGVHVLTDGQWVPRFRSRLKGMLHPDGLLNTTIYYNDTFVSDFKFYHELPWAKRVMGWVETAKAPEDHPLLTEYEFDQWRKDIVALYQGECPKHDPVRFVTQEYINEFVDDSIAMIEETYRRAFE